MKRLRDTLERGFVSLARVIYRNPRKTLAVWLVVLAALGSSLPRIELDMSIEGFFRKDDPTYHDYNAFRDLFGREETLLVAVGPTESAAGGRGEIFTPTFLLKLRDLQEDLEREVPHLEEVTSLVNARQTRGEGDLLIVDDLMDDWPETPQELADLERRVMENPLYRNILISEDGRLTAIVLRTVTYSQSGDETDGSDRFEPAAEENLLSAFEAPPEEPPDPTGRRRFLTNQEKAEVVRAIESVVERHRAPDFPLHLAGSAAITEYLNRVVHGDMFKFAFIGLLLVSGLLTLLFRRFSGVAFSLLIVLGSLFTTFALLATVGVTLKMSAAQLPSFLLAVGVADAVHVLTLFYRKFDETGEKESSIAYAFGHSGIPIVLTSLTTAAGLGSFVTARLADTAEFGLYASFGVMIALAYTLLLLPALIRLVPMRPRSDGEAAPGPAFLDRLLAALGEFAVDRPWGVLAATALLLLVAAIGAGRIVFSQDAIRWLPEDEPLRIASELIDREMEGSVSFELVVDTNRPYGLYEPAVQQKLEELAGIAKSYRGRDGRGFVGQTMSVADILKETNRALNDNRGEHYRLPDDRELIAQELLLFENAGSDDLEEVVDAELGTARFSARVPFEDSVDYIDFVTAVEDEARQLFGPEVEVTATGLVTLLTQSFQGMIFSMRSSYLIAGIVISVMMILLLGCVRLGLLSMAPNLSPILLTLGIMGWFGMPMDTITILIGSIAIGLVVDDTVHFMWVFRRYYDQEGDIRLAVRRTVLTTGRAMLFTTLVLATGFAVYMSATLSLMFNFGLLLAATILFAFLADVLLAPALLRIALRPPERLPTSSTAGPKRRPALRRLWRVVGAVTLVLAGTLSAAEPTHAQTGRQVVQRMNDRDDGDNQVASMEMILISKNGTRRVRRMRSARKDVGKDTREVLFFEFPADVKGTGFLVYDYYESGRDDDQWLYLPALHKTKRIAGADQSGSFMGSDFNFSDMSRPDLDDYTYRVMGEPLVDEVRTWQVEMLPKDAAVADRTGYSRSVVWIRQDNDMLLRAMRWVHKSQRVKFLQVTRIEEIDGIQVATELQMSTKEGRSTVNSTVLRLSQVEFDNGLDDDLFTVRRLEKGL